MRQPTLPAPLTGRAFVDESGCWIWTAAIGGRGYGAVRFMGRVQSAHRVSYELLVGPIPDGLVLDHLCRERSCINPDHLEAVTHAVNIARGEAPSAKAARLGVCQRNHSLSGDNLYVVPSTGRRACRECRRLARRAA